MKKFIGVLSALLLLTGTAFAEFGAVKPNDLREGDNYGVGTRLARADQDIEVTIPQRLALHIDTDEWNLDLGNIGGGGEACFYVSKSDVAGWKDGWAHHFWQMTNDFASNGGAVEDNGWDNHAKEVLSKLYGGMDAKTYPAVDFGGDGRVSGDDDKGYMVCYFGKIVQKFSNVGWVFETALHARGGAPQTGFGQFGIADIMDGHVVGQFTTKTANSVAHALAKGDHTNGWLDDFIVEAFYFDGTEKAGSYDLHVSYTLTANP